MSIKIKSSFKNYEVNFVNAIQQMHILNKKDNTFFVFDKKVFDLYKDQLPRFSEDYLFLLSAEEDNKNIDTFLEICEKMTNIPSKRNTTLVSVGGGIIQDVTGYVASSLYRGIDWILFPTTLLSACDSCIGGKSSLNFKGFKNLLGSFYPPDVINIDSSLFHTLSRGDLLSGLGEVVKFNVLAGKEEFCEIENNIDSLIACNEGYLIRYIQSSLEFKKDYIEEDEFDKGKRIYLNFAHTFGHAFEASSNYLIPHGSAVAMGMIVANDISVQRGILNEAYAKRIESVCKKILDLELDPSWFETDFLISKIKKDKKQTSDAITAVLFNQDNSLLITQDVTVSEISWAVKHLLDIL